MARPRRSIGSYGDIWVTTRPRKAGGVSHVAMVNVRDPDGVSRQVSRSGASERAAKAALRAYLVERIPPSGGVLSADSRLMEAVELWRNDLVAEVAAQRRSPSTLQKYDSVLVTHIRPRIGGLLLRELTVPRCEQFLAELGARSSRQTQGAAKTVLGNVLGFAARKGAIQTNPIRDTSPAPVRSERAVALTADDEERLLARLRLDAAAVRGDFPDLVALMLATGCRIGEMLALTWEQVNLGDPGPCELRIEATLVQVRGEGLQLLPPKSAAGLRTIEVASSAQELLTERWRRVFDVDVLASMTGPVFPSRAGGFRDPANTEHAWAAIRGRVGFAGLRLHTLRKTAATVLLALGAEVRDVSDRLGHSRTSMTLDHYAGRGSAEGRRRTAELLERRP